MVTIQVSLHIQDDLYQKALSSGIDIQSKFNEYIANLLDKKQFQENKKYFQNALNDLESGKDNLIPFNEGLDELDDFIDNVK